MVLTDAWRDAAEAFTCSPSGLFFTPHSLNFVASLTKHFTESVRFHASYTISTHLFTLLINTSLRDRLHAMATLSLQNTLPKLPVPTLEETLAKYLHSIEPLATPEELERNKAHAKDFLKPGGLGQTLQQRLLDVDRAAPNNWLDDTWWIRLVRLTLLFPLPFLSPTSCTPPSF